LALAVAALALDAFWLEPDSLILVRTDIALPGAPALKGLRISVITDLHAGSPFIDAKKIDAVVAMTNHAKPDLILLAGDYVTSHTLGARRIPIAQVAAQLGHLSAPLGVYAVLGNHDRWLGDVGVIAALRGAGIAVLTNSHVRIATPHGPLVLVGIGDLVTEDAHPARALAGVAPGTAALCLTHVPDVFAALPSTCRLVVAGHTHGGQVALPLIGRPAVGLASRYGQRYAAGVVRENGRTLFVGTGIGTTGLGVRFGVPPQVALLVIH
jgi:predicted MPP superfamily phosphohydrolase